MRVELLYFDGCPNWRIAAARLDEAAGVDVEVVLVRVETPEKAAELGFLGSPTILVDGVDPFAVGHVPAGLACRRYDTPTGAQGSPTLEQLRAALGG